MERTGDEARYLRLRLSRFSGSPEGHLAEFAARQRRLLFQLALHVRHRHPNGPRYPRRPIDHLRTVALAIRHAKSSTTPATP